MLVWSWLLLVVYALIGDATAAAVPPSPPIIADEGLRNANHIFNAIHSSMRQWGSSLNHNGMSLFLAQVPAGTQFYHGTGRAEPVRGMEWLAFEPEHAVNFARSFGGKAGGTPFGRTRYDGTEGRHSRASSEEEHGDSIASSAERRVESPSSPIDRPLDSRLVPADTQVAHLPHRDIQHPFRANPDHEPEPPRRRPRPTMPGWLHTYKTKTDLPLLYIDGMSAGKCDKGTLDTQDILLLNATNESDGVFWEYERAERLCHMASETWNGKIKGFIRMESGFEVILCSFAEDLDFIQAVRAGPFAGGKDSSDPDDESPPRWHLSDWIRAITARYDGIGGGRVKLDYDNFVTAYDYNLELFTQNDGLPRLGNASVGVLEKIRGDVDAMVHNWDPSLAFPSVDWQNIADMVVERYAKQLKYLVSGAFTTSQQLSDELSSFLRVFVDSDARNTTAEVGRCATQFIPHSGELETVSTRSIRSVTTAICSTLFAALDAKSSFTDSVSSLHSLIEYLDWTVWKRCPECPLGQVCFIPIWPFGAVEDRDNPQCRNLTDLDGRMGYWAGFGPGHPPHNRSGTDA
ncbi:hypothetical protein A1O1_01363 [Capronia coronata CBS 617.96]|uniref:Uncharacterized protein n=1 Tax=Capronia coronata CBS 617.96 TaxID=1182541 RepID=W9YTJ9_9EURO|nr:uncharacterized protein A1O1_01363 [Capronia coronata CBS 617.96]EXJ96237.1 hypothetical protein A1O1_01363 [Capronia coronata CBS 617.96]